MASVSAGAGVAKPSYSKIAATGLKPPSTQANQNNNTGITQKNDISSSPRDGSNLVSPSNESKTAAFTPKQKKLVPLAPKESKEVGSNDLDGLQVNVQNAEPVSPPGTTPRALEGKLMPTTDDTGTQISSSSGSAKPPSLDGKSVTSGTTFALDEKESLRPDDSASVKANEDEDTVNSNSGLPDSRTGSDNGVQRVLHEAFRDQLREISSMEPTQQGPPPNFVHGANPPQGVLYVPPQGSGVGIVPGQHRPTPVGNPMDPPPDPKLLEALESPKDRIMVLKLEQDIVDFVKDPKEQSLELPQTNAFYRMLAHRLADYYMLGHAVDQFSNAVRIYKTPHCRLPRPLTGVATPSTAASTPPPTGAHMKILRRGTDKAGPTIVNGSNTASKTTSENGESGNDDEKRTKAPATREEREARYEAARKRIMGSARPAESPEQTIDQDISRSSSAAGKKPPRRKQRSDSDDDFEARSAYSAVYPPGFSSGAPTPPTYGFTNPDAKASQFPATQYGGPGTPAQYQQFGGPPANNVWQTPAFQQQNGPQNWMVGQQQQQPYNLPAEFQRALVFPQTMPNPPATMQPGYPGSYAPQFNQQQQTWPQQQPYAPNYQQQPAQSYGHGYTGSNFPAPNQTQDAQPYAYGQLPSQTIPNRPPNKLEHPLPGSYVGKNKHFNPQSQAFIPGHGANTPGSPYGSHAIPMAGGPYGAGYGMPGQMQRQSSTPLQHAAFGSPRGPPQSMTHPLPQPVFPRQPSPNMPLPAKPETTPPRSTDKQAGGASTATVTANQNASSIAKWGAPASLPAKPPPPAEPTDAAKVATAQRQPPRLPPSVPAFGSMPPMMGAYNAQGVPTPRRA